jgi:hypothetical protein
MKCWDLKRSNHRSGSLWRIKQAAETPDLLPVDEEISVMSKMRFRRKASLFCKHVILQPLAAAAAKLPAIAGKVAAILFARNR